jgi:hypothetical protein
LKTAFLDQIDKGHLVRFEPTTNPRSLGAYSPATMTMQVNIGNLDAAANNLQKANALRTTLGHEIKHAARHDQILAEFKTFVNDITKIANKPSPHDYTAPLKTFNENSRALEINAEIAGFNALARYVRSDNPRATLVDLYEAAPDRMWMYIDKDRSTSPPTYTPKSGLTLANNLEILATQANINAMGEFFYKTSGYPELAVDNGAKLIDWAERNALSRARITNPAYPTPVININLKEVGAPNATLPSGWNDTSLQRQAPTQAPQLGRAQSGPFGDPHADRYFAAFLNGDSAAMDRIANEFAQTPLGRQMALMGDQALAEQQRQELEMQQARKGPAMSM